MSSGRIRRSRQLRGYGVFYFAFLDPNNKDFPTGPTLDTDFREVSMLLRIISYGDKEEIKGGRRDMGCNLRGEKCLHKYTNIERVCVPLAPSSKTTTAGSWVALDTNSGEIVWSTTNLSEDTSQGPVSVVNGVLFAGSVASNGPLYALDANNGAILWMNNTRATIYVGVPAS
ncbi:hypothetical protein LguiB_013442 [Lonicera macranthoides]